MEFSRLFEPMTIRSLGLKNRIMMPCLDPGFAGEGGRMTQRLKDYFVRRAQGGVAFILVGPAVIDPLGIGGTFEFQIYRDEILEGLAGLADALHGLGVPIGLQLHHAGRQANPELIPGDPVAPSAIACPVRKKAPRPLSLQEIEGIVHQYGDCARRVKEVGFDAVEVHGSHGYLIAQFLSPLANAREDRYGGGLENRARLAREVLREARRNVGPDFPIFFRIAGEEHVPGGLAPEETSQIARQMEEAGADVIHVSAGNYRTAEWIVPPMTLPRGCNVPAARAIKQKVKIPVAVAGRIPGPELAEEILAKGEADIIAMGRGLVADPDLPLKAMEGRWQEIRPCIACNVCIDRLFGEKDIVCTVNPEVGREQPFTIRPASVSKKVMVIGGGPAGMEAARVARLRGHRVSLFEEDPKLGGRFKAAFQAPFKQELKGLVDYYEATLKAHGVDLHLGIKATPGLALTWKPDAVVIAAGSVPFLPPIAGADLPHVVQAVDVLLGESKTERMTAVVGGGTVGCEVAAFLAERGSQVTIVEMLPYVAHGVPRLLGKMIKEDLKRNGVQTLTHSRVIEITRDEVIYEREGKKSSFPADSVVLAVGTFPRQELMEPFKRLCQETYLIGDCLEPRKALEAIHEGAQVGHQI